MPSVVVTCTLIFEATPTGSKPTVNSFRSVSTVSELVRAEAEKVPSALTVPAVGSTLSSVVKVTYFGVSLAPRASFIPIRAISGLKVSAMGRTVVVSSTTNGVSYTVENIKS